MPRMDATPETLDRDLNVIRSLSPPTHESGKPGLVILYGLPGSGKSCFGELLSKRCGAVILNSDHHRRAIVNGAPRYNGPENKRLFDALNRRVEELLDQGQVVIFDSTALREWIRRPLEKIASDRGLTPVRVHLDPPAEIIFSRLLKRQPAPDPASGNETWRDVYDWMLPGWQPIAEPHLRITDPERIPADIEAVCQALCGYPAYPA